MRLDDWKQVSLAIGITLWIVYIIAADAWREYATVFAVISISGIAVVTATFIYLIARNVKKRTVAGSSTIKSQMRSGIAQGRKQAQDDNV